MDTQQKTILVVDDETDLREALKTALGYEHFNVITAEDGVAGLAIALSEKPDLILLDITMPKMDGVSVLKSLRADEWGKSVKVIVMTALDDLEKIAEVVEAGGDEYLVKTDATLEMIVGKVKTKLGI